MSIVEEAWNKARREAVKPGGSTHVGKPSGETPPDERIVCLHAPSSAPAEEFRRLRQGLALRLQKPPKSLGLTSARRGEGKTIVSLNLAYAMARANSKVIVVDADLHKPSVAKLLRMRPRVGLDAVLKGESSIENAVIRDSNPNLAFLCGGGASKQSVPEPGSLGEIAKELKKHFDYVIFDCAPLLPVADTAIMAPQIDGIVLVVEAGKIRRRELQRAIELLEGAKVLGFVLNKGDASLLDYGYRYKYHYHYAE